MTTWLTRCMSTPQPLNNTSTHPGQILLRAIAYFLIDAQIDLSHLAGISWTIGRLDPFFYYNSCIFFFFNSVIDGLAANSWFFSSSRLAPWFYNIWSLQSLVGSVHWLAHRQECTGLTSPSRLPACLSIFCEILPYLFKRILFFTDF